ncbi:MAG: hypothetical protein WKG52_10065 [Variovorax sp.]
MINDYRREERSCDGSPRRAAGPLAENAGLANVQISADSDLQGALKKQGYLAARVQAISISGPAGVSSAMPLLKQRYCRPLLDSEYADIGVSREGNTWRIVHARPVLPLVYPTGQTRAEKF